MATRNLLARSHLPAFREYLAKRGWVEQKTKGEYEVMRFTHPEQPTLIVFARTTATVHVTVQDRDYKIVQQFIRDRHAAKR